MTTYGIAKREIVKDQLLMLGYPECVFATAGAPVAVDQVDVGVCAGVGAGGDDTPEKVRIRDLEEQTERQKQEIEAKDNQLERQKQQMERMRVEHKQQMRGALNAVRHQPAPAPADPPAPPAGADMEVV